MPSGLYSEEIYAPVRRTTALVKFELVAPEAKEKATLSASAGAAFSRQNQLIDSVTDTSAPVATLEPDYWRLDGSFVLPVLPEKSEAEIGWWSAAISDENGLFGTAPMIEVAFSEPQDIALFGISFDAAANEAVADLEFFVYDSGNRLILQEKITGNTATYATTASGAQNVARIVVKIYKTKNPCRRARVSELTFGVIVRFDGADIMALDVVNETDPSGKTFPTNELNLKIMNNGRFDQLDSESLAQYLHKRQTFEYSHGLYIAEERPEWVFCGAYLLDSWTVSDDTVTFVAKGKSALLENSTFYGSTFTRMTVGDFIKNVFAQAGFDVAVPPVLYKSPAVAGYLGNVPFRQAATYLAEAGVCAVRENRQNTIDFIDLLATGTAADTINYDNMFLPPKIKLEPYYNGVILKERTISAKNEQLARAQVTVSGSREARVYFDRPLYGKTATCTVSSGFSLSNIRYSAMFMTATLKGTGTAEITVTGESAAFATAENFYSAPWRDPLEPDYGYVVDLPLFFTDNAAFRTWFLERKFRLLQKRLTCTLTWRQNPAQEVGGTVIVQANKNNHNVPMTPVSEKIDFSGGVLRGSTKTIGEAVL
jgi:hypothetical protein